MQAAMEPTTKTKQVGVPVPSVSYEKVTLIEVRVIVFPPQTEGGDPIFDVDPITIPGSGLPSTSARSVLIWTLVDGSSDGEGFATLEFANPGFTLPVNPVNPVVPSLPPGFHVLEPRLLDVKRNKRLDVVENNVSEIMTFNYVIDIKFTLPTHPDAMFQAQHDPTIVLTKDPIEGG
jgi:hypothetical protein